MGLRREQGYTIFQEPMQAGDATVHARWTLHSAPDNSSDTDREVMTVLYYTDRTYIINPPDNPAHSGIAQGSPQAAASAS